MTPNPYHNPQPHQPDLISRIDRETFLKLQRDLGIQQSDLDPYYKELDRQLQLLSKRLQIPVDLLRSHPIVPVVSMKTSRPRLRDRIWARIQTARRLLFRLFRR